MLVSQQLFFQATWLLNIYFSTVGIALQAAETTVHELYEELLE